MPFYSRAFCTSDEFPALSELQNWLESRGTTVRFETDTRSTDWSHFHCHYANGRLPIVVEANRIGADDGLAAEERGETIAKVRALRFSVSKRWVLKHLTQTKFIVCCQFMSDIDEVGHKTIDEILSFFVQNHNGLVHCGGDGFFLKQQLVLHLP